MAGLMASALLQAGVTTAVYVATAVTTVNIRAANQNGSAIKYRVAIGAGVVEQGKDVITPDVSIGANEPWEDQGIMISAGETIWCTSNKDGVSVRVFGG